MDLIIVGDSHIKSALGEISQTMEPYVLLPPSDFHHQHPTGLWSLELQNGHSIPTLILLGIILGSSTIGFQINTVSKLRSHASTDYPESHVILVQ